MTVTNQPLSNKFYITFWGTRGSIPTPGSSTEKYGGNTPCVSIKYGTSDIIFDGGTGIRNLGIYLAQQAKRNEDNMNLHLFLSHTHWDHIQGIPFFSPAYIKGTKLTVYGSQKKESFLEAILSRQMDVNYFPVEMNQLAADISIKEISQDKIEIGPVVIEWQEQVVHPGGCVRYKVNAGGKKIIYATDVELDKIFSKNDDNGNNEALAKEYCDFIKDADLLIADGQYTEEEYPQRIGFGHSSIPVIIDLAFKSGIKQLAIFHHDPQHSDTMLDKLWKTYAPRYASQSTPMNLFWAREGMTIAV